MIDPTNLLILVFSVLVGGLFGVGMMEILERKTRPYEIEIAYKFPIRKPQTKMNLIISSLFILSILIIIFVETPIVNSLIANEKVMINSFDCRDLYTYNSIFHDVNEYKNKLLDDAQEVGKC